MGYDESATQKLIANVRVGVVEEEREGVARDLWRITKLKPSLKPESAVLIKEYFVHPRYYLYYETRSEETLLQWKSSFEAPFFALSLGSSDDLCLARKASVVELQQCRAGAEFKNTILPFSYRKRRTKLARVELERKMKIRMPQVFSAPTLFENNGGVRKGVNPQNFTYVSEPGLQIFDVQGAWTDGERSFFMF